MVLLVCDSSGNTWTTAVDTTDNILVFIHAAIAPPTRRQDYSTSLLLHFTKLIQSLQGINSASSLPFRFNYRVKR